MGSRGAFVDFENNNFTFVEGGQKYIRLNPGSDQNVEYLIQVGNNSVKVPDYSHSPNKVYAVIQNGKIKAIGTYEKHIKLKSYDLLHSHSGIISNGELKWHYHTDLFHKEPGQALTSFEVQNVYNIIIGGFKYL